MQECLRGPTLAAITERVAMCTTLAPVSAALAPVSLWLIQQNNLSFYLDGYNVYYWLFLNIEGENTLKKQCLKDHSMLSSFRKVDRCFS